MTIVVLQQLLVSDTINHGYAIQFMTIPRKYFC